MNVSNSALKNISLKFENDDECFTKTSLDSIIEIRQQQEYENKKLKEHKRKEQKLSF